MNDHVAKPDDPVGWEAEQDRPPQRPPRRIVLLLTALVIAIRNGSAAQGIGGPWMMMIDVAWPIGFTSGD
jgi:hypothetical protein